MTLVKLRCRDKRYKRLHERTERYHQHKQFSSFIEYYESEYSRVRAKGREEVLLESEKRLGKLSKKASKKKKNIK